MNFRLIFRWVLAAWLLVGLFGVARAQSAASPLPLVSTSTGTIFINMGELGYNSARDEALTQINATPFYKSMALETRFYDGWFRADANTTKLALLSDDGTSVWINDQLVLNRAGQGQGFEAFESTFVVLSPPAQMHH